MLVFVFGWKIRKVNDAFKIKTELRYLSLTLIPFVLLIILSLTIGSKGGTANTVVELLVWAVNGIVMTGLLTYFPVWLSFSSDGSDDCFLNESDDSESRLQLLDVLTREEYEVRHFRNLFFILFSISVMHISF